MSEQSKEGKLVFVYDSIMRGMPNHRAIRREEFIQEDTLKGASLVLVASFPGMVLDAEGEGVKGELYKIRPRTIEHLDKLYGVSMFFTRQEIKLASGVSCEAYLLPSRVIMNKTLPGGDWRAVFEGTGGKFSELKKKVQKRLDK